MKGYYYRFVVCVLACLFAFTVAGQPRGYGHRQPRVVVRTMPRQMPVDPRYGYDFPRWRPTYYGLRIGLNGASVRSDSPALDGKSMKAGLSAGFVIGHQLSYYTPLFIEGGLYYTQKGGKSNNAGMNSKFTYDLGYFELPVVLKYRHFTRSGLSVEPFLGGFLAVGVTGEMKDYVYRNAQSVYDDGYFNRFDGGIRLGIGVGYGIAYGELAYDLGLANVGQDKFDNTHTGCLTLSVGVNF